MRTHEKDRSAAIKGKATGSVGGSHGGFLGSSEYPKKGLRINLSIADKSKKSIGKKKPKTRSYMERVIIQEILNDYVEFARVIFDTPVMETYKEKSLPPAPGTEPPRCGVRRRKGRQASQDSLFEI